MRTSSNQKRKSLYLIVLGVTLGEMTANLTNSIGVTTCDGGSRHQNQMRTAAIVDTNHPNPRPKPDSNPDIFCPEAWSAQVPQIIAPSGPPPTAAGCPDFLQQQTRISILAPPRPPKAPRLRGICRSLFKRPKPYTESKVKTQ